MRLTPCLSALAAAEVLKGYVEMPGIGAAEHNFWLFPIIVANPATLIAILRRHGFDATQGASQLNYTPLPDALSADVSRGHALEPQRCRRLWFNLLYLPVYPEMPRAEVVRMAHLVKRHACPVPADGGLSVQREGVVAALRARAFDVLVVGGGINGAAVARDAAMRGLRVALVERDDFGSGASGNSAKLVHGGFRYVEHLKLAYVHELCSERDLLHRQNPNMVGACDFLLPQYGSRATMNKIDIGLWLYDLCARLRRPWHTRQTPQQALAAAPLLRSEGLVGCFRYRDCWTNDARLTLANVRQAAANGAVVLNHCTFEEPLRERGRVVGARVRDLLSDGAMEVRARHIVYATGSEVDLLPWQRGPGVASRVIEATKGTLVAVPLARLPLRQCVGFKSPADGRWCFCVPYFEALLVGTTDTAHAVPDAASAQVCATRAEVDYLLEAVNAAFPQARLGAADVFCSWAGLRPLLCATSQGTESFVRGLFYSLISASSSTSVRSREDKLFADPCGITVIGGAKLTPYRLVAQRTVDAVVAALSSGGGGDLNGIALEPCLTHLVPLDSRLSYVEAGTHQWWYYGSVALWLRQRVHTHPDERAVLDPALPMQLCEVSLAVLLEQACTLEDVLVRRLGLFFRALDQGRGCAPRVARHMAALMGRDEAWVAQEVAAYERRLARAHAWRSQSAGPALVNLVESNRKK